MFRSKGFIPAEDIREEEVESFPYFPVDDSPVPHPFDVDPQAASSLLEEFAQSESPFAITAASIASDLEGPEATRVTVEERIVARLQEAEQQAQEIAREAYETGFASGESEGRAYGESQYRIYQQRLEEHFGELTKAALHLREGLNEQLVALALAVGEHLALQQIEQSGDAVQRLLERVLEELPFPLPRGREKGDMPLQVYLNPADLESLGDRYVGHEVLALAPDPALSRGSLRVETPQGVLNGSMETRRDRLREVIARLREEGGL